MQEEQKKHWYDRYYKIALFIPIVIFLLSIAYLTGFYINNGDLFNKDVSITGGTTITVFHKADTSEIADALKPAFTDLRVQNIRIYLIFY